MLIFKLYRAGQDGQGVTRRLTFQSRPTWSDLSTRIEALFEIPIRNIGCSYVDSDGDKVTLSTDDELLEYCETTLVPGQPIKFTIEDLATLRRATNNVPSQNRNTFLTETEFFDVGEDWQRLGPQDTLNFQVFPPPPAPSLTPHGFIESLHSEAESTFKSLDDSEDDSESNSVGLPDTTVVGSTNKGKGKASTVEDFSSTDSVLGEDAPVKPPIHVRVLNASSSLRYSVKSPSIAAESEQGTVIPVGRNSPVIQSPKIPGSLHENEASDDALNPKEHVRSPEHISTPTPQEAADDPPLPPIADTGTSRSLVQDLAHLLASLQRAFASHPELSEGLRNIIQNATNGTYWSAHRDAIHHAAEGVRLQAEEASRTAEETARWAGEEAGRFAEETARRAEEEAARRVAEAVGNIAQTLSASFGSASRPAANPTREAPHPPHEAFMSHFPFSRPLRRHGTWAGPVGRGRGSAHGPGWSAFNNIPFTPFHQPPPPPPPPPHFVPPHFGPTPPPHPPPPGPPPATNPHVPVPPPSAQAPPVQPDTERISYSEQRQRLREAKRLYKLEKTRYRQQHTDVRNTTSLRTPAVPSDAEQGASVPNPETITASNPRGNFPGLEVVSVPGWGNPRVIATSTPQRPTTASPHRRHTSDVGSVTGRHAGPSTSSVHRITRRLADMGFTQQGYKELPAKIAAQVGEGELVSKEREDDIVTTLLDELLAMSPRSHRASTFIAQNGKGDGIPGSWN